VKKVTALDALEKQRHRLRRKKDLCTQCGGGYGGYRKVGAGGKFERGVFLCIRCYCEHEEALKREAEAYRRAHPTRLFLSLWGEGLVVCDGEEQLPEIANDGA
jgi:hypothetical protein